MNLKSNLYFVALILGALFVWSCSGNSSQQVLKGSVTNGYPEIRFDTTYHDFGNLVQGEKVSYTFKFKNTGTGNLLIKDAYSTCGCTVPNYDKEPIAPRGEGGIEVVFNTEGKMGVQYKSIKLKLNTKIGEKELTIKANVFEK